MSRVSALFAGSVLATALGACTFSPGTGGNGGITGGAGSGLPSGQAGANGSGGSGLRGGSGGSSSSGAGGLAPTADANCGQQTYGANNLPGDVLIILDKSGSMANDFNDQGGCNGAMCKWPSMTVALNQVVMQTQAMINWGLKYFPNDNACAVNAGAAVPIATNNAMAISNSIAMTNPGGRTPTTMGVSRGVTYLNGLTTTNPRYILLATDGQPNCAGGNQNATDDAGAVMAVANAYANGAGIPVFVVGVGNVATSVNTLNMMAAAGGKAQPPDAMGRTYFPADNPTQLVAQLSTISGQIVSCNFALASVPPVPQNILVRGDGVTIPKDTSHANGWDYGPGMMSVILYGSYCDMVKSKAIMNVETIFGCQGVPIIP